MGRHRRGARQTAVHDPGSRRVTGADIAISPDGGTLAVTETYDNNTSVGLRLRSTSDPGGQPLATIDELDNGVAALAFSPTKPILAVSDLNGWRARNPVTPTIRVYDIADPRQPRQIAQLTASSLWLAFSPDGETLTSADNLSDGEPDKSRPTTKTRLRTWNLTDPARPAELWTRQLPPGDQFRRFAFSPDGALFAAYEDSGTLRLWRVNHHQLIGDPVSVIVGAGGGSMAFSPDGTRLALIAVSDYGDSRGSRPEIWDLTKPDAPTRQSYLPAKGSTDFYSLAFSPDGGALAVVRASAGVDLWDTDPERIVTDLCNAAGDPITPQQWERYLPGRPYRPPCQ